MNDYIQFEFDIYRDDYINGGKASSEIKKNLKQIGLDPTLIRRIAIATYEAEMNMVIHSYGGKIKLFINDKMIKIISEDIGPGIKDIDLAMTPGFSTANEQAREMGFGAGMGLPNMKKNADLFDIHSNSSGTTIEMSYRH